MKFQNLFFLLLFGLLVAACGDDDEPEEPTCDTTDITYANGAAAILNGSCAVVGCHVEGTTTFSMSDYSSTLSADGFNKIIGSINHTDGFTAMPLSGDKLADCDINKLTAWINDGAPE